MKLVFLADNCESQDPDKTPEIVAERLNKLGAEWNAATRMLTIDLTYENFYFVKITAVYKDGSSEQLGIVYDLTIHTFELTEDQANNLSGFSIDFRKSGVPSYHDVGTGYVDTVVTGQYIYPTGVIDSKELPVTQLGFAGFQSSPEFTHIRMMVAEIYDGGVGGAGHVWVTPYYDKNIDYTTLLHDIAPLCEGKKLANFNVLYQFAAYNPETKDYDYVDSYIVGDATNVTTFSVSTDVAEEIISVLAIDGNVYCLSPAILQINRQEYREIQSVQIEVGDYTASYEFFADRNILEIDIAEYLKAMWANIDVFEFQQMQTTIVVKLFDASGALLETQGVAVTSIYGKHPEPETPEHLRLQWLDKFGHLHDVIFKVFQNVAEGSSAQKYVVNREEHEEKNGERSLSLAYVGANASQRIALETIVFADHVRAYFNGNWKRVKVANTYKNGTGREKRNFEITIKYAI